MKDRLFIFLFWLTLCVPLAAQDKLYPVRDRSDSTALVTTDRASFSAERSFQHRLIIGFPEDDRLELLPDTKASILVFWLRVQNIAQRPMEFDILKFSSTDDHGQIYSVVKPEDAANRMFAEPSNGSIGTRTLRGISLGRVANKRTETQIREDLQRYSLKTGQIPAGGIREGFIYFEAPQRKKYTLNVILGDLRSKPLVFSTEKQK